MSLSKHFSIVAFFLSSLNLLAQQFMDVLPDGVYIQERYDFQGDGIIKINPDLSVEHILPPVLPKGVDLKQLIAAGMRPKIRFDHFWISDNRKIYKKPLDAEPGQEWELIKLPDGLLYFCDFEIISDKETVICGAVFKPSDATNMPRLDMHLVFNHKTGDVTTSIDSYDFSAIPYDINDIRNSYAQIKQSESYVCRFNSRIIIVGKYSGVVTLLDLNPDSNKLRRFRKIQIIPESEIPKDPQDALNNGSAINWIGPLLWDDVLICCRMWIVPKKNPSGARPEYCFRTLNLDTGKVTFEGASYRDRMAESHLTLYEDDKGKLLSVREVISERLKQIEQAKKPKPTPAPEQPEKQTEPPDTETAKQSKQIELNSDISVK